MGKNTEPQLTEKKMSNHRFYQTEEAISKAFFDDEAFYVGADVLARKAGVSRSTVNRHHGSVRKIVSNYKKFILRKYKRHIRKITGRGEIGRAQTERGDVQARQLFSQLLLFILHHKYIVSRLIKFNGAKIIEEMVIFLEPWLKETINLPVGGEKILVVWVSETTGLVKDWVLKNNCKTETIQPLLNDLMFMTKTACTRLARLQMAN